MCVCVCVRLTEQCAPIEADGDVGSGQLLLKRHLVQLVREDQGL